MTHIAFVVNIIVFQKILNRHLENEYFLPRTPCAHSKGEWIMKPLFLARRWQCLVVFIGL